MFTNFRLVEKQMVGTRRYKRRVAREYYVQEGDKLIRRQHLHFQIARHRFLMIGTISRKHDYYAAYGIACCVFGVGSLGIPHCYAIAGFWYASFGLVLLCLITSYASVALSKCLLATPEGVHTYGDLGEYVFGRAGRYIVVVLQFSGLLMMPIVFLVLGGAVILPNLCAEIWPSMKSTGFIIIMGLSLLPVVVLQSKRKIAGVAAVSLLGMVIGDCVALIDSNLHSNHYQDVGTKIDAQNVLLVFGTFSMAYGAAVVIPGLQRNHAKPENMPKVIVITSTLITFCYMLLGIFGYYQYGCLAPSNLLLSMSNRSLEIVAMIMALLHIALAFAMFMNPAFFVFERYLFMHDSSKSYFQDFRKQDNKRYVKVCLFRSSIVAIQMVIAIVLQESFKELVDFVGATAANSACVIMPLIIYVKMFSAKLHCAEKCMCYAIIASTSILSIYCGAMYLQVIIQKVSHSSIVRTSNAAEYCLTTPKVI